MNCPEWTEIVGLLLLLQKPVVVVVVVVVSSRQLPEWSQTERISCTVTGVCLLTMTLCSSGTKSRRPQQRQHLESSDWRSTVVGAVVAPHCRLLNGPTIAAQLQSKLP